MAMLCSACSNRSSQSCGAGQDVWLACSQRSIASSISTVSSASSSTKSLSPTRMTNGTLDSCANPLCITAGNRSQLESVTMFHFMVASS